MLYVPSTYLGRRKVKCAVAATTSLLITTMLEVTTLHAVSVKCKYTSSGRWGVN